MIVGYVATIERYDGLGVDSQIGVVRLNYFSRESRPAVPTKNSVLLESLDLAAFRETGLRACDLSSSRFCQCERRKGCLTIRRRRPVCEPSRCPMLRCNYWRRGGGADLLDGVRQADLTQQRLAAVGLAAHVSENVFLVGSLHPGARRRGPTGCGSRRIGIVQSCSDPGWDDDANSLKRLAPQAGFEPATLRLTA